MDKKEIEINGKKYSIKELSAEEALDFLNDTIPKGTKESNKYLLKLCVIPQITDEVMKEMGIKELLGLLKEVNKINGFLKEDFQASKV